MERRLLTTFTVLVLATLSAGSAKEVAKGELSGEGDEDVFLISSYMDLIVVTFEMPADARFRVAVYGQDEDELGDFDLSASPVVKLLGNSPFRLRVYSASGGGPWRATWKEAWRPEKFEFPWGKKQAAIGEVGSQP
jgi:hypothetical protein